MNAPGSRNTARYAIALTVVLFGLRWNLASLVGFGDAEALYAAYALHPQPAYLDHPGLVGAVARFLGNGLSPNPIVTHRFTTLASAALPWLGFGVARIGLGERGAFRSFFALALLPEISIGLFALTPDLPLAFFWLAALGAASLALRSAPDGRTALGASMAAGFFAGLAVLSKASGVLLLVSLGAAFASKPARRHLRAPGPWCGLVVALLLATPLGLWEQSHGCPLLFHRLVATETRAGLSLRNIGALLGGQLLYVTPPFLAAAYFAWKTLSRRATDPVDRLLVLSTLIPGVVLGVLCLWSRVAEPHWVAPAYLALALGASRLDVERPRLDAACAVTGVIAVVAAWLAVATPLVPKWSGASYVPRYDLVNDLFAWQVGLPILRDEISDVERQGHRAVVVGPHWTVCAQVHAALGPAVPVVCRTPSGDDFADWYPERRFASEPTLLYVTDDRFAVDPAREYPDRDVVRVRSARVYRGGRNVRTIRVARLDRTSVADVLTLPQPALEP